MTCVAEKAPGGLLIYRNALDPKMVEDARAECAAWIADSVMKKLCINTTSPDSPIVRGQQSQVITDNGLARKWMFDNGYVACHAIGGIITAGQKSLFALNRQDPLARQVMHADGAPWMAIAQLNDGGLLDQCTVEGLAEAQQLERAVPVSVGAGDVVVQTQPLLPHRGRSAAVFNQRYNLVAYTTEHRRPGGAGQNV